MLQIRSSLPRLLPRAGLVLVLALAGQVVFLPPVSAATLTVTSTADVATNFGACGNTGPDHLEREPARGGLRRQQRRRHFLHDHRRRRHLHAHQR